MKMKKILKVVLGVIGSIILIVGIVATVFHIRYKDWVSFHRAMINNDIVEMQKMLDQGYNINDILLEPYWNISHLKSAVSSSDIIENETIKFLITNGAEIDYLGRYGVTPLITSLIIKRPDISKILIDKSANLSVNINGNTITDMALVNRLPEIIMMIPEDKINSGIFMLYNPGLIERVIQYYYEGQTDDRILNHWEKHGYFSKTYIDNIRKIKK